MKYRNAQIAFEEARKSGRLVDDAKAGNYIGHYMYMGTDSTGKDLFKHVFTREYVK